MKCSLQKILKRFIYTFSFKLPFTTKPVKDAYIVLKLCLLVLMCKCQQAGFGAKPQSFISL